MHLMYRYHHIVVNFCLKQKKAYKLLILLVSLLFESGGGNQI